MLHKMLDKLLAMHFKSVNTDRRLDRLEQDIWRKINIASRDMAQPWYDKMVMALSVPQFRVASLAMALIIGIMVGSVITFDHSTVSANDMLGMNIFTAESSYLPSNIIEQM